MGRMQLEAAGGRVRCGGCLKVFDARDHFLVEQKSLFDQPLEANTGQLVPAQSDREDTEPADTGPNQPDSKNLSEHPASQLRGNETAEGDESQLVADMVLEGEPFFFGEQSSETKTSETISADLKETPQQSAPPTIQPQDADELNEYLQPDEEEEDDWEPVLLPEDDEDWLTEEPANSEDQDTEQLFVAAAQRRSISRATLAWSGVCFLLLLLGFFQTVWLQPDWVRQQPGFARAIDQICPLLNCPVTPLQDLQQIDINGLVLPSQQYRQSLLVQAEIRNRATLPQHFPAVQLDFLDLRGQVIASRRFQPREYLRSEASGRNRFEPGQRIQVQLEIYDPGEAAISYRFALAHAD